MSSDPARTPPSTAPEAREPTAPKRVAVLIVDDLYENCLVLQTALEELGQELVFARSGQEALRQVLQNEFAVILLDVNMPDMDGFETARLIRKHPRAAHTPIIFITAYADEMQTAQGYSLGAVDYMLAPVVPEILRTKVQVFVELHQMRLSLAQSHLLLEQRVAERTEELMKTNEWLRMEIAARERLEEELRQASRRKDEFLATLAHELRNPLSPIRNAVQMLHLKKMADPELIWARDVIERQTLQLVRLIDDLLDVSRIAHDKLELRRRRSELSAIVNMAVETSRPLIESLRHQLDVSVPDYPVTVDADPARLAQVVANLLNNAARYTEPGGHITLVVEHEGHEVVVRVTDTGLGIPADSLPTLFDLFTQIERGVEHPKSGLGIGLALVKRFTEMHGGSVSVHSRGTHQGSTFTARMPIVVHWGTGPDAGAPLASETSESH